MISKLSVLPLLKHFQLRFEIECEGTFLSANVCKFGTIFFLFVQALSIIEKKDETYSGDIQLPNSDTYHSFLFD